MSMRLCVIVVAKLIWHVEHPRLNQAEEKANPTKTKWLSSSMGCKIPR